MSKHIDATRYPLAAAYVAALPEGIAAYPECQMRTDFTRAVQKDYPTLLQDARVPDEIKKAMDHPWAEGEWMPIALMFTLQTLFFEIIYKADEAPYKARVEARFRAIIERPLYRASLHLLSPNLLLLGAGKRWSHFMRGVTLEAEPGGTRTSHTGHLTYPAHLLSPFALMTIRTALTVAISATRATDVKIAIGPISPTQAQVAASWG